MVTGLQEINSVLADQINNAMFFCQPPGPRAARKVFERFRLPDALKRLVRDRLNQIQRAKRHLTVGLDSKSEILGKFRLKDRGTSSGRAGAEPISFPQAPIHAEAWPRAEEILFGSGRAPRP